MTQTPDFSQTAPQATQQTTEYTKEVASEVENFVRQNPAIAIATAVGIGCAVGIIAKLLLSPPPPPKNRAQRILEDIQHQLSDLVGPAYDRATHLAEDSAAALKKGVNNVQDLHLHNRLKRWFV